MLLDVTIPGNRNVIKKEAEDFLKNIKISQYKFIACVM
jgi:hypothetical protein